MNTKKTSPLLFGAGLLYFGLFTSSFAQTNNPINFQITEMPLPINATEMKQGEKLLLNSCGLLQSPNHQDTLAYCYGNVITPNTQVEKAWIQLLSTNDNKLSWLRDQPFSFVYHASVGRQLEALDNTHHLMNSNVHAGLGYIPLNQDALSKINDGLTLNSVSAQTWIYKKNITEDYFDPKNVVLTGSGSFVLKLQHSAGKDEIDEDYILTQFDAAHKIVRQTSFKQDLTEEMISVVEDQRDRLDLLQLDEKDEKRVSQYEEFIQAGQWLSRSSLAQPTLIVSSKGQIFTYLAATNHDPAQQQTPDENSLGTKLYCVSPDGKSKFEHFIPGEFFSRHAAAFSPEGNILLLDDANDNKTQITFNLLVFNPQCTLAQTPLVHKQQLIIPIKDQINFAPEILQVKTTASGDIIVVYLDEPADWGVDQEKLFPYQLNIAIFSKEGKLKMAKPIISADQPAAWYLHPLPGGDYIFPAQRQLSIDLKIGADNHSAFVSVFNPVVLDENAAKEEGFAFRENEIGKNATWQGVTYQAQPKFFKITW